MAKCSICNARKGKRPCELFPDVVCSSCCGEKRDAQCIGCEYCSEERREYDRLERCSYNELANSDHLTPMAQLIEETIQDYDGETGKALKDHNVIEIIEKAIDHFWFNDSDTLPENLVGVGSLKMIRNIVNENLHENSSELLRVLSAIRWNVLKRTNGNRNYIESTAQYFQ